MCIKRCSSSPNPYSGFCSQLILVGDKYTAAVADTLLCHLPAVDAAAAAESIVGPSQTHVAVRQSTAAHLNHSEAAASTVPVVHSR
jgi:hypothetical protein